MSLVHIIPANNLSWQHSYLIQPNPRDPVLGAKVFNHGPGHPSEIT